MRNFYARQARHMELLASFQEDDDKIIRDLQWLAYYLWILTSSEEDDTDPYTERW